MANYETLKAAIQQVIAQNGTNAITGQILQSTLLSMVNSLGAQFQFAGVATPTTDPGTPDQRVFYIAYKPGVYANFGGVEITGLSILRYTTQWAVDKVLPTVGLGIFKAIPGDHYPVAQFYDFSIANAVSGKLYWLQIYWTGASYQQLTLFRTNESSPSGYDSYVQLKTVSEVHSGVQKYSANFSSGEQVTIVINWDLLTPASVRYNYQYPNYVLDDKVFTGGLIYHGLRPDIVVPTDKTLELEDVAADAKAVGNIFYPLIRKNELFTLAGTGIWAESVNGHIGGEEFMADSWKSTDFIPAEFVYKIVGIWEASVNATWAGIAYYDESKNYLGCTRGFYYNRPAKTVERSEFPANTYYVRFCTSIANGEERIFANLYSNENITEEIDRKLQAEIGPQEIYWAACGDSITNANHGNIYDVEDDDPYCPIDGYAALNTYKRANYAYYIAKKNRIKWANYGYGGTTLHHCAPKAYSNNFYPFVDTRIEELKEGIEWDYITIFFGWNDCAYGPTYQRDLWLQETYGTNIGYPVRADQIGASGFATAAQKAACDAATGSVGGIQYDDNNEFFFARFIGTINDTTKNTWMGAWNYAIEYLLKKYPKTKIMIVAPYINTHSLMVRNSVKAIAEKWGVIYFDFEDLPYWYSRTVKNTTRLTPPTGTYWFTEGGQQCEANIDGYSESKYSYDRLHPSNLGYRTMAGPFGDKLING